ncbi:hypothetical protein PEC302107_23140 [Pectobacterium araliae]|uniref:Uncharacterized protein n=1 Tax=Pectobacterium araliae TaxID=3073862 RepID=A0AAN0KAY3_9GAMM|nr:hypothetical protein PEC302110_22210 [Pectobacterium sp. MAFF 302110]GKW20585.1 hypothetical protein PEC302107_23140 [Pectobacterium carotovorum subsp. carotovorum]
MIFVRSENIKSNHWLAKIARGDYGVRITSMHLAVAVLLVAINYFLLPYFVNGSVWGGYLVIAAIVFYGIYVANIGMGFWRLARTLSGEVKTFLLRILAAGCVIVGISAIFNGLAIVFALLMV